MITDNVLFDPLASHILNVYLINYINFLKISPDIVGRLLERRGEFELVPIPKTLLEHLQTSQEPGLSEDGGFDFLDHLGIVKPPTSDYVRGVEIRSRENDLEKAKYYHLLIDLLRFFGQGIENGDLEQINRLVSANYSDYSKRTKTKLMEDIQQLLSQTSSRRLIIVHVGIKQILEGRIAADVTGAWEAEFVGEDRNVTKTEFFTMEIYIERNKRDLYQIINIKLG